MNKKGSILQIVLLIFLTILSIMTIALSLMKDQYKSYHDINMLMKQKNIEMMLVRYYTETLENDILLSHSFKTQEYQIDYTVDDMGTYYLITTYIDIDNNGYKFILYITNDTFQVTKIEYKEG